MNNPLQYPTRVAVAVFNEYCTRTVTAANIAQLAVDQPGGYITAGIRARRHFRSLYISLALLGTGKMNPTEVAERYKWLGQI